MVLNVSENVPIRTIKDANAGLLRCWIAEKLTWSPPKCIIYCGLRDITDNIDPETILDYFCSLVSKQKRKTRI